MRRYLQDIQNSIGPKLRIFRTLPAARYRPTLKSISAVFTTCGAVLCEIANAAGTHLSRQLLSRLIFVGASGLLVIGCSQRTEHADTRQMHARPQILVVAPVVNLSDADDIDPLRITDWVASSALQFPGIAIVPVNMTVAALAARGSGHVESAEMARDLARELQADATLVVALTEYNPYDPPRVGMIAQMYGLEAAPRSYVDPVMASRAESAQGNGIWSDGGPPTLQVQRTFDASTDWVRKELKQYARLRDGNETPFGWRRAMKSQEHFVRYCSWSTIRTMVTMQAGSTDPQQSNEATE